MGDPTVILLLLNESTSDSLSNLLFDDYKLAFTGESGCASLPRTWTTSTNITWPCFVLDGPWTSWRATTSLSSSFTTPSWTEWILRGLWDARRCFTSSHQDQWWLSCACALHFLALLLFHSDVTIIINHKSFVSTPTPPLLFPLHPSRGHLVTSIHSMILDPANCTLALCHLVTGIYPITPRRCLYCWLQSSLSTFISWVPLVSLHLCLFKFNLEFVALIC